MSTEVGSNSQRMARARESLRGRWGLAVGGTAVYFLIAFAVSGILIVGSVVSLLVSGALSVGLAGFTLALARKAPAKVSDVFTGFDKFGVGLGAYLLQGIFVFLWCLLLIVPGIIAALSYALTYYVIVEEPTLGPLEAISKSKRLMQGHKWELFCLGFRFLGWAVLCVCTLGIGLLWLAPYVLVTTAHFYDDVKAIAEVPVAPEAVVAAVAT